MSETGYSVVLVERLIERMLATTRDLAEAYDVSRKLTPIERVRIFELIAKLHAETQHLFHQVDAGIKTLVEIDKMPDEVAEMMNSFTAGHHQKTWSWIQQESERIVEERKGPRA